MLRGSLDNTTSTRSPLGEASQIRPEGRGRWKRSIDAGVVLTSLVDAFSILVIYLLVNFSTSGEILYLDKGVELPSATQAEQLERSAIVKILKDEFYLEDKKILAGQLTKELVDLRKKYVEMATGEDKKDFSLTVQTDRRVPYKLINKVVLAGSHAGFHEVRFAVLAN